MKDKQLRLFQAGHLVLIGVFMLWYGVSVGLSWDDVFQEILTDTLLFFLSGLVVLIVKLVRGNKYDTLMRIALVVSSFYPCLLLLGFPIGSFFFVRMGLLDKGYLIAIVLAAVCGTVLSTLIAKALQKKSGGI